MLNPLSWIQNTQDWFSKTEKSSGFRSYLIFFIIASGLSLVLLFFFKENEQIAALADFILRTSVICFVIIFALKAFFDPDFCRSEKHIQTMYRIESEQMGSETNILDAKVLDNKNLPESTRDGELLLNSPKGEDQDEK